MVITKAGVLKLGLTERHGEMNYGEEELGFSFAAICGLLIIFPNVHTVNRHVFTTCIDRNTIK